MASSSSTVVPNEQIEEVRQQLAALQAQLASAQQEAERYRARAQAAEAQASAQEGVGSPSMPLVSLPKPARPAPFKGKPTGTPARIWLEGMEMYLTTCRVPNSEWVIQAASYLQDDALIWWAHLRATQSHTILLASWDAFKSAVLDIFEPFNRQELARDRLHNLRQVTSVQDYAHRFRQLLLEIDDVSEATKVSDFVRGLKPEVKRHVKLHAPTTLNEAFVTAIRADTVVYATEREKRRTYQGQRPKPMELGAIQAPSEIRPHAPDKKNSVCHYCKKRGHWKAECRLRMAKLNHEASGN